MDDCPEESNENESVNSLMQQSHFNPQQSQLFLEQSHSQQSQSMTNGLLSSNSQLKPVNIQNKRTFSGSKKGDKSSKQGNFKKTNKRSKTDKNNQQIDIEIDHVTNLEEINLDQTDQTILNGLNVNEQMQLIKFMNSDAGSLNANLGNKNNKQDKQTEKHSKPIPARQNEQQLNQEQTLMFELANKLIELSNKLVEPKAMNKLSMADKSNICDDKWQINFLQNAKAARKKKAIVMI